VREIRQIQQDFDVSKMAIGWVFATFQSQQESDNRVVKKLDNR